MKSLAQTMCETTCLTLNVECADGTFEQVQYWNLVQNKHKLRLCGCMQYALKVPEKMLPFTKIE